MCVCCVVCELRAVCACVLSVCARVRVVRVLCLCEWLLLLRLRKRQPFRCQAPGGSATLGCVCEWLCY